MIILFYFCVISIELKVNTIVPLIRKLAEKSMDHRDITSSTIAREIGKILEGLQSCLTVADSVWFLELFNNLSHRGLAGTPGDIHRADASQVIFWFGFV